MEQRTSKGGMTVSKNASYRQAKCPPGCNLLRRTEKSTEKSIEKSTGKAYQVDQDSTEAAYRKRNQKSTVKSTKSIKILLKPPLESATMKSTGWSPKRTSKDDYLVNQHLGVNATTGYKRYSTEHAEALHEGSRERRRA